MEDDFVEEIRHLRELRSSYKRRLYVLEIKEANMGMNTNAEIIIEIEHLKNRIEDTDIKILRLIKISKHLNQMNEKFQVDAHPSEDIHTANDLEHTQTDSEYRAELVSQKLLTLEIAPGTTSSVEVKWKNIGRITWTSIVRMGPAKPKERFSLFYSKDLGWFAPNRITFNEHVVSPNQVATFRISLAAPTQEGIYRECFGLLVEDYRWFDECPIFTAEITVRNSSK